MQGIRELKQNSIIDIPWEWDSIDQYTGIVDKNKIEVYEGDILAPLPNDFKPKYKNNWVVIFEEGTFLAKRTDNDGETWLPYWCDYQIEVIGNVHKNNVCRGNP